MIALAYRCLRREFEVLQQRQPQAGKTPTPRDVHQTRIATRRMRVALRLFGAVLPGHATRRVARELRWFAGALGKVRDLDVHSEALREHLQSVDAIAARQLGAYELGLRRERLSARDALHALFSSHRYTALMTSLTELLDGAPSPAALRRWRSFTIRAGAPHYLKRARKRVIKLGRRLRRDAPAKDLHRLRIRTKRLRYALEFFLDTYPELSPAAKATAALQDLLGAHQDARTARRKLLAYAHESRKQRGADAAAAEALARWRLDQHRKAARVRDDFEAGWQRFTAAVDLPDLSRR